MKEINLHVISNNGIFELRCDQCLVETYNAQNINDLKSILDPFIEGLNEVLAQGGVQFAKVLSSTNKYLCYDNVLGSAFVGDADSDREMMKVFLSIDHLNNFIKANSSILPSNIEYYLENPFVSREGANKYEILVDYSSLNLL